MQVFEKILERLEELSRAFPTDSKDEYFRGNGVAYKNSKDIVEQMYKEYNNGWIPCKDKLPEKEGTYLTSTEKGAVRTNHFYLSGEWGYHSVRTVAWQPLPEPYSN